MAQGEPKMLQPTNPLKSYTVTLAWTKGPGARWTQPVVSVRTVSTETPQGALHQCQHDLLVTQSFDNVIFWGCLVEEITDSDILTHIEYGEI